MERCYLKTTAYCTSNPPLSCEASFPKGERSFDPTSAQLSQPHRERRVTRGFWDLIAIVFTLPLLSVCVKWALNSGSSTASLCCSFSPLAQLGNRCHYETELLPNRLRFFFFLLTFLFTSANKF